MSCAQALCSTFCQQRIRCGDIARCTQIKIKHLRAHSHVFSVGIEYLTTLSTDA